VVGTGEEKRCGAPTVSKTVRDDHIISLTVTTTKTGQHPPGNRWPLLLVLEYSSVIETEQRLYKPHWSLLSPQESQLPNSVPKTQKAKKKSKTDTKHQRLHSLSVHRYQLAEPGTKNPREKP
jgi:hypothetical protein